MHCLNAFVISACKFICPEYIFRIVVVYLKQTVVFPFFRFFRMNLLRNLNIDFLILPRCYKVDFSVICFSDMNGVSSAAKLQVYNVFKTCGNAVGIIAENAVPQSDICKIEFFLLFSRFPFPANHTLNSDGADMPFPAFPDSCKPFHCQGNGVPISNSLKSTSQKRCCPHC